MDTNNTWPPAVPAKTAVITGGTQGVGEATARRFADSGAAGLVICGRNRERGEQVAESLSAGGCPTHFQEADLADLDEAHAVFDLAERTFDRVDCLVNAAGVTDRGSITDTTPELFDRLFAVNTRAPYFLMQRAVANMRRHGAGGAIVNVLSISSHGGQPFISAYCGSKGALAVLTKNVAHAVRADRIRVNGLNIGWTDTPEEHRKQTGADGQPENWRDAAAQELPFGRLIQPQEVANAITYLASSAAGVMTGSIVDFDQTVIGALG